MSSSSAAFARAISPALMGITEAIHLNTVTTTADIDLAAMNRDKLMIFQASVTECCSIDQVIDCVYLDYRPVLKEHLLQYTSWCKKRETVRTSHEHWIAPWLHSPSPHTFKSRRLNFSSPLSSRNHTCFSISVTLKINFRQWHWRSLRHWRMHSQHNNFRSMFY